MINIFIDDSIHKDRISYVIDYIFMVLGLDYIIVNSIEELKGKDNLSIVYSKNNLLKRKNLIFIKQSNKLFNDDYLKPIQYTVKKLNNIVNLMGDNDLYINESKNEKYIETNIDIISDIFFLLSRYEEVVDCEENYEIYNRFSADKSLLYKENLLHRPLVNEHIFLLWQWINSMELGYKRKKWWGDYNFATIVSHDVDFILKYRSVKNIIKEILNNFIKEKSIFKSLKEISNFIELRKDYKKDPYYTFNYILDIERNNRIKSSFYFMTGGNSKFDNYYNINDDRVLSLINEIEEFNFEVGLHCSFNSYNDIDIMKSEKNKLDGVAKEKNYGCRQHYLRFKATDTWKIQNELGLKYDSTLGYADKEGFRAGTCFPFRPYDLTSDKILDLWEIPLIVMEGTLDNENYSNYTPEEGYDKTIELIKVVEKYEGVFTLLWHNSSLDKTCNKFKKWIPKYEEIMTYIGNSNSLNRTGSEIIDIIKRTGDSL